jgi:hypothetical protein
METIQKYLQDKPAEGESEDKADDDKSGPDAATATTH